MPLAIIRHDITQVEADAIVNAANSTLQQGGGVCGAIFAAAGAEAMQAACDAIGHCAVGKAVITSGFQLPARYVIHTVGPVWQGGQAGEETLLASCYRSALELALQHHLQSVAFPLIASGIYGYPRDEALRIAINTIGAFLLEHDMHVSLVVYDPASYALSERLFSSIAAFIDDNYVARRPDLQRRQAAKQPVRPDELSTQIKQPESVRCDRSDDQIEALHLEVTDNATVYHQLAAQPAQRSLEDLLDQMDETFSQMLLRLIDERRTDDVAVYKRANIDRRLFSKIRSDKHYKASKPTALALAIALELNLDETRDLLARAGFALSHSSRFDIIVEYLIREGNYNIFEINEALFAFEQPLLGI